METITTDVISNVSIVLPYSVQMLGIDHMADLDTQGTTLKIIFRKGEVGEETMWISFIWLRTMMSS
jgi:hypothetical protein